MKLVLFYILLNSTGPRQGNQTPKTVAAPHTTFVLPVSDQYRQQLIQYRSWAPLSWQATLITLLTAGHNSGSDPFREK